MGRKKAFDKKSSVTFKLVHRSQRDPLAADESAPQMVLVDVNDDTKDTKRRREEQKKYGIYFDDDYNYLQHLRDVEPIAEWQPIEPKEKTKVEAKSRLQLPSSMFASAVQEKEGLLNKAVLPVGPQPDWDPEVVAAMDEDFDFDDPINQIDDDFILQADTQDLDQTDSKDEDNDDNEWEDVSDSQESDEENESTVCGSEASDINNHFSEEETKSHFTNYSMSSSVIRRNENLSLLDQRFETLYESEYANDCDIGALDFDDIEGNIDPNNSQLLTSLAEEYQIQRNQKDFYEKPESKEFFENYKLRQNLLKDSNELTEIEIHENSKKRDNDRLDCESIISTYSNLYNRPKIISESNNKYPLRVRINEKTGLPIGVLDRPGLTARKLAKLDALNADIDSNEKGSKSECSRFSRLSELSVRIPNETPEQRRERKFALKEYRRERRTEKKANKEAFKSQQIKLNKEVINLQKNINAVKLI